MARRLSSTALLPTMTEEEDEEEEEEEGEEGEGKEGSTPREEITDMVRSDATEAFPKSAEVGII